MGEHCSRCLENTREDEYGQVDEILAPLTCAYNGHDPQTLANFSGADDQESSGFAVVSPRSDIQYQNLYLTVNLQSRSTRNINTITCFFIS